MQLLKESRISIIGFLLAGLERNFTALRIAIATIVTASRVIKCIYNILVTNSIIDPRRVRHGACTTTRRVIHGACAIILFIEICTIPAIPATVVTVIIPTVASTVAFLVLKY